MKHLYIIGNGFDRFTGLDTSYESFRQWLKTNYAFIYENMCSAYKMDGEWWCDFETQLGKLDVINYVKKYTPFPSSISFEDLEKEIKERKLFEKEHNILPSLTPKAPCAERLRGLLDVLRYCFEKWVRDCQKLIENPICTHIEKDNSFFINFNYTDTLQWLYSIPEAHVLHIHGRASKHDHLIFGHNSHPYVDGFSSHDVDKTCQVLCNYQKNPYDHIFKCPGLKDTIKDTEFVHVYGLSFSPVDEGYFDWIVDNTPFKCEWEISWFSDRDKKRVEEFILNHWSLKDRCELMQLNPEKENSSMQNS